MGNVQHTAHGKEQPATQEGDMVENGLYIYIIYLVRLPTLSVQRRH